MRSILLGAAVALGLAPTLALASVSINVDKVTALPSATEQTVFVDVFGVDLPPEENELLNVFTIAINGVGFSPTGVRFQLPTGATFPGATYKPTAHKFVFRDQGFELEPGLTNVSSTASRIQVSSEAIGPEDVANLTPANNGFIRLPIIIPANATGFFPINVDLTSSQLGGAGAPIVTVLGEQGSVTIVPEPASLGLIVLGGLLTLRRRRVA
jgi:hypothetical protein